MVKGRVVLFVLGVLFLQASEVIGQNDCHEDNDCMTNQYCYTASNLCANYTQCTSYNREEGPKPARQPSQCGDCISGYTAEKLLDGEPRALCQKTTLKNSIDDKVSETSTFPVWAIVVLVTIFGLAFSYVSYRLRTRCLRNREPENEKPTSPPMLQNNNTVEASAPPLPLTENNNNSIDAEESSPLSTHEYHGNTTVVSSKPVKAHPFRSPWYVNANGNYNPGDTSEAVVTVGNFPETDEDTVPSPWRPSADQANPNSVPNRPFHAINMEQEDNETNTALDNIRVCPSSSNNSEERLPGSGHQQNGTSTSEDAESNNNRRGHTQSIYIQLSTNSFVSLNGCGKDC